VWGVPLTHLEDRGCVGCAADVLSHLDRKCSGRRTCRMVIPDATLHGIHPCPKELMPYLEASYLCVRGIASSVKLKFHGSIFLVTSSRGCQRVGRVGEDVTMKLLSWNLSFMQS